MHKSVSIVTPTSNISMYVARTSPKGNYFDYLNGLVSYIKKIRICEYGNGDKNTHLSETHPNEVVEAYRIIGSSDRKYCKS